MSLIWFRGFEILILIFLLIFNGGCSKENPEVTRTYLFLGHPYDWNDGYRLDPRLERIDYQKIDQVWLGGDVCSRTTERPETLVYLDSILDFSDEHIQWTLGNHDVMYGHPELITERTGKPSFYTTSLRGGITLMVLNTNLFWMNLSPPPQEGCAEKHTQLRMMLSVLDTITESSHLVILHHHSLLKEKKPDSLQEAFNMDPGSVAVTCELEDQFTGMIYPKLVAAQKAGVEVVLIGGDLGMRVKEFAYQTPEGIWLLGSGINNSLIRENAPEYVTNFEPDKILVLHHNPEKRSLTWEFVLLDEFVAGQVR